MYKDNRSEPLRRRLCRLWVKQASSDPCLVAVRPPTEADPPGRPLTVI